MSMRFRRALGAAVLTVVLSLACGVAVAAAQTVPVIVGSVSNPSTGPFEDGLSGAVSVATQDTSQGWFAYTPAYYNNDLTAISMADPTHPAIVGEGGPSDGGTQVYGASTVNIFNGIAYVVSKNLNGPCTGGSCTDNNYAPNGIPYGNALSLFDVGTNPAQPQFLGSVSDNSLNNNDLFGAYGVTVTNAIDGNTYALVAAQGCLVGQPCPGSAVGDPSTGNDLAVINVGTTTAPTLETTVPDDITSGTQYYQDLDHPTAVAVSGNYAYVTSFYGHALTVINLFDNPSAPKTLDPQPVAILNNGTSNDFPYPSDVTIQGNYAYVINQNNTAGPSGNEGTFTVVDISNPLSPTVVGTVNAIGLAGGYRVRVSGNTAYVASHLENAITTVDVTNPADPIVVASAVSRADLSGASGLDLMNIAGNEYVAASSPELSTEANYLYPPFPSFGNTTQTTTGTISALELEAPPANSAPPAVTGSTLAGSILTVNVGSWSGTAPLSYSYQWQRCDTQGANCTVLKTATQTYPVGTSDVGHTLRAVVKASNGAGSQTATSPATAVVAVCPSGGSRPSYCALPRVLARPRVTGTTKVGQRLGGNPGTWSELAASAYGSAQNATTRVEWLRCNARGARCKAIAGATHTTYRLTNADLKRRVKLEVIATNRNGTAMATSAPSAPIVSSRTKLTLSLTVPRQPRLVGKGFVVASLRSNVGALLDVLVDIQIGNGSHWVTGTPTEARPGVPLRFRLALSAHQRRLLRQALKGHKTITAAVTGVRFIAPGHAGVQRTVSQHLKVTG